MSGRARHFDNPHWVKRYREQGLAGLVTTERKDKGKPRTLPDQAITLVEGLALQTPPRSAAAIHRQVVEIATKQGWKPPSYERVRLIIKTGFHATAFSCASR